MLNEWEGGKAETAFLVSIDPQSGALTSGVYASLSLIQPETRFATYTMHRPSDLITHRDCSYGPGPGWISSWPVSSLLSRTFYCCPKPDLLFLISRLPVTPTFLPHQCREGDAGPADTSFFLLSLSPPFSALFICFGSYRSRSRLGAPPDLASLPAQPLLSICLP